jgi:peptidoglycan DL-endopeptidase CwlO
MAAAAPYEAGQLGAAIGSPLDGSTGAFGADVGQAVVTDARQYLGVPYLYGGTNPATGLDCSSLVQRAYADLGISLPRTSQEQAKVGTAVTSLADARPGDLVAFGSPATHIGIYVGNGQMIVAPQTGSTVQVQDITTTPSTIRRIVAAPATGVTGLGWGAANGPASRPAALGGPGANVYAAQFTAAETKYGLPAGLLSAVAQAESGYNASAVSSAGAIGLMQLMPATANALGVDATDPTQSIDGAARLLRGQLSKYGSIPLALAAYNAGGPAVDKYGGIPPYAETQAYVQKVLASLGEDV